MVVVEQALEFGVIVQGVQQGMAFDEIDGKFEIGPIFQQCPGKDALMKGFDGLLMPSQRRSLSARTRTQPGDQKRSAIAAVRGQIRESTVSGETYSAHIVASPPSTRAASSSVRSEPSGRGSLR